MDIALSPLANETNEDLKSFFLSVITDAFYQNDIYGLCSEEIPEQVKKQMKYVAYARKIKGRDISYFVAKYEGKIIGTIARSKIPSNIFLQKNLSIDFKSAPEVASVYVLPDFQRKGVGSFLFQAMVSKLKKEGFLEFCLDSGYPLAQKFWKKKLGLPEIILKDYWSLGCDHMFWKYFLKEACFFPQKPQY